MKNLASSILVLISLFSFASCQKEMVEPKQGSDTEQTINGKKQPTACSDHYYYYNYQPTYLGKISTQRIIVGFEDSFTYQDKVNFIASYPFLDSIQAVTTSGSADVTTIALKAGLTCTEVDNNLKLLAQHSAVRYATPTYKPSGSSYQYLGVTNQFIVTLKSNATYEDLQRLAERTNTQIVSQLYGPTYILSAVKTSDGNALEMANYFHENNKVDYAEPDFLVVMP